MVTVFSFPKILKSLDAGHGPSTLAQNRLQDSLLHRLKTLLYSRRYFLAVDQLSWFLRARLELRLHFFP